MRFFSAVLGDIRYQIKYGFYFLYAFISIVYIIILLLCPPEYKQRVASVILLTDPASLGIFFIGGIWLLEKNEGLHSFWVISPLHPVEYVLSKAASLGFVSTLSALVIAFIGIREQTNYLLLAISIFAGSMVFTMLGLYFASYAKSVNHYLLIVTPLATLLTLPPILAVFGLSYSWFTILPGMALWRIIVSAFSMEKLSIICLFILALWFVVGLSITGVRISAAMKQEGGKKA